MGPEQVKKENKMQGKMDPPLICEFSFPDRERINAPRCPQFIDRNNLYLLFLRQKPNCKDTILRLPHKIYY